MISPKSLSNRESTLLRKLGRTKHRKKEGLFLAEGERAITQIIKNGSITIKTLFFDDSAELWNTMQWSEQTEFYPARQVPHKEFITFADTQNPQGILALCHIPEETTLEELVSGSGVIVACDAIQDPGNLGAIYRTAAWFGASGIILGKGTVDLFNPKVVRSTAGSTGTIPRISGELQNFLELLESGGWKSYLLEFSAPAQYLHTLDITNHSILVVGNEANGISEEIISTNRTLAKIASPGNSEQVESLNAAVAFGIAIHHFTV